MQMMILVLAAVKIASYGAKVNHVNIYNGIVRMGNVVIIEAHCRCQLRVVEEFVSSKLLSCSISSTARPLHGGEADLGAVAGATEQAKRTSSEMTVRTATHLTAEPWVALRAARVAVDVAVAPAEPHKPGHLMLLCPKQGLPLSSLPSLSSCHRRWNHSL